MLRESGVEEDIGRSFLFGQRKKSRLKLSASTTLCECVKNHALKSTLPVFRPCHTIHLKVRECG